MHSGTAAYTQVKLSLPVEPRPQDSRQVSIMRSQMAPVMQNQPSKVSMFTRNSSIERD